MIHGVSDLTADCSRLEPC